MEKGGGGGEGGGGKNPGPRARNSWRQARRQQTDLLPCSATTGLSTVTTYCLPQNEQVRVSTFWPEARSCSKVLIASMASSSVASPVSSSSRIRFLVAMGASLFTTGRGDSGGEQTRHGRLGAAGGR